MPISPISLLDLTTLNATDDPARVEALCHRAIAPAAGWPSTAAVCVFPTEVPVARRVLPAGGPVRLASVAGAFPHGHAPMAVRLAEVRWCVEAGADEIDMVVRRDKVLAGDEAFLHDEVAAHVDAADGRLVKVILETGELEDATTIAWASDVAIAAGAHFLKTSTGKSAPTTLAHGRVMLERIAAHLRAGGAPVGFKPAGGIRTPADATAWMDLVEAVLGPDAVAPDRLRLGASSLLDALLAEGPATP